MNKPELLEHTRHHVFCRLMPSSIHGIGVFAVREIAEGVQPFAGCDRTRAIWVRPEELSGLHPEVRRMVDDFCAVQDGWVYLPRRGFNAIDVQYYVNHSDQPNLVTVDGGSTFQTARDIRAGEELTVDYRTYNDPMP